MDHEINRRYSLEEKPVTPTKAHDIARAIMRDSVETTEPSITEQALARLKKLAGLI